MGSENVTSSLLLSRRVVCEHSASNLIVTCSSAMARPRARRLRSAVAYIVGSSGRSADRSRRSGPEGRRPNRPQNRPQNRRPDRRPTTRPEARPGHPSRAAPRPLRVGYRVSRGEEDPARARAHPRRRSLDGRRAPATVPVRVWPPLQGLPRRRRRRRHDRRAPVRRAINRDGPGEDRRSDAGHCGGRR